VSKKILILVEGQTEEGFINRVLAPYFHTREIFITPTIIKTKKEIRGPDHKGGVNSYNQVKRDLRPLFNDTSVDVVTTMIDYYALPGDFPGYDQRPHGNCYDRVEFLENQFGADINQKTFLPYLQLHEFEALVFASETKLSTAFIDEPSKLAQVSAINNTFASPEEINEDPKTAPSRRLKNIFPNYQKTYHSQLILSQVNIEDLRTKCPHFNSWVTKLES